MASEKELFFQAPSFAVVGNTQLKPFPELPTYKFLRERNKRVIPVDLGGTGTVLGDKAYSNVEELPETVAAAIVELPRANVLPAVEAIAHAGIKNLWLHQGSESDAVLSFCAARDMKVCYGSCAVMYAHTKTSYHTIHKGLWKLFGKY